MVGYVITWFLSVNDLTGFLCHVIVVLKELCRITFTQEQFNESLQMHGRVRDILMKVSPESEEMANGRQ